MGCAGQPYETKKCVGLAVPTNVAEFHYNFVHHWLSRNGKSPISRYVLYPLPIIGVNGLPSTFHSSIGKTVEGMDVLSFIVVDMLFKSWPSRSIHFMQH